MINISKKEAHGENFLFINYVHCFAVLLCIIHSSLIMCRTKAQAFIPSFNNQDPSLIDSLILIGNVLLIPTIMSLFGLTVFSFIKQSPTKFLKDRILPLGMLFVFSAFIIMPLSYYFSIHENNSYDTLWNYITKDYFELWLVGPTWIFPVIILFDIITFLIFKYCPNLANRLVLGIKELKILHFFLIFFFVTFLVFILSTSVFYKAEFITIPTDASWTHAGPIWWQENVMMTYFIIYLFSMLLGSSEKLINYIFASKGNLASKWLHRLLETIILYLALKFIEPMEAIMDSVLLKNILWQFLFLLLAFSMAAAFFSILNRFAYRKSKVLSFFSNHSLMIYTVYFLPLALTGKYVANFDKMIDIQKTYVVAIFTFLISLLISFVIKRALFFIRK